MLENNDSLEAVGMRLKFLRTMARLNRIELAEKANVGRTSITCWEHAQTSPMTSKSRSKILKAIRECGVDCTEQWLLTGCGIPPALKDDNNDKKISGNKSSISNEIALFKRNNKQGIVYEVPDDSMSPFYRKGDVVGGIWRSSQTLSSNNICIVEIDHQLDLRQLSKSSKMGNFIATHLAIDSHSKKPYELRDIYIKQIAPIIRLWRDFD